MLTTNALTPLLDQPLAACAFLAQTVPASSGSGLSGGTVVVLIASLAAGLITGLCIWREDRKRIVTVEGENAKLRAKIKAVRPS